MTAFSGAPPARSPARTEPLGAIPGTTKSVQLYPALDLRSGRLARAGTRDEPHDVLARWHAAGATWAHVTDLDRTFGTGDNTALVRSLLEAAGPAIQLGGGLVGAAVDEAVTWGARRVIVGARGGRDLAACVRTHGPERIAFALDVRDGMVRTPTGEIVGPPGVLLDTALAAGVRTIVVRDLARDGTLMGAALDDVGPFLGKGLSVVLAGGLASLDDLRRARDGGIDGAIVGRALLEGRFTIEEALACCG